MNPNQKNDTLNAPTEKEKGGEKGYYINGKSQVVEILKMLKPEEREKLLKNIYARNPAMAFEFSLQSLKFSHIERLSDHELSILTRSVPAALLGLALKSCQDELVRRILRIADRRYAEEAYESFTGADGKVDYVTRAQNKVLQKMLELYQGQQLQFKLVSLN